jgi:hypothetical protein
MDSSFFEHLKFTNNSNEFTTGRSNLELKNSPIRYGIPRIDLCGSVPQK